MVTSVKQKNIRNVSSGPLGLWCFSHYFSLKKKKYLGSHGLRSETNSASNFALHTFISQLA